LQKLLLVIAAALALAGLTVSAIVRIGRMRARRAIRRKRRAMWDTAKTKRRSPQPMFHDEDARLRRTEGAYNPRVPQDRTRVPQAHVPQERPRTPQERPRVPQERTRVPQERTTRVPQERPRPPQERRHVPQDRVPHDREREQQVTEMLSRLARSAQP
jgi:FtsZ-interacting cell division protein ZipA